MAKHNKPAVVLPAAVFTADTASLCCSLLLAAIILLRSTLHERAGSDFSPDRQACDEIYVVGEGETLNTIIDKCGDPYIVERNPHVHDHDDVFPGLAIRIVPDSKQKVGRNR